MLADKLRAASSAAVEPLYVEDVFSTYLYTGNGASQSIVNGIDLAGGGGMVWIKNRGDANSHCLFDTIRGINNSLFSNATNASTALTTALTAFNADGFTLGNNSGVNGSGIATASWTFRQAPKFFDVVTYTGNGAGSQTLAHDLGVAPGMVVIKAVNTTGDWMVYHVGTGQPNRLYLNTTGASVASSILTSISATNFAPNASGSYTAGTPPTNVQAANVSGVNYVAYLFAHDTSDEGVIQCGALTTDASGNATVTLGWEPQYLMVKASSVAGSWLIEDDMRGFTTSGQASAYLLANTSGAEASSAGVYWKTATGFGITGTTASATFIYMAIRRPMKTPTAGTEVYTATTQLPSGDSVIPVGFNPDMVMAKPERNSTNLTTLGDRLRGNTLRLYPSLTNGEETGTMPECTGFQNSFRYSNNTLTSFIAWAFRRAPGFMDVVCYTGTGVARTVDHNLGVVPELMIVKRRDGVGTWWTYSAATGATKGLQLNTVDAASTLSGLWDDTAPTSSVFTVGTGAPNGSGWTFVTYLFATLAGVSKVGSYTGTGTTLQVDCGFTGGARFVLIKRTDSTGDWYVWDTARGIISGNDPYLLLNSTAAEVTSTDYIDSYSAGFEISSTAPAAINASGGTFIFLAIA